MSGQEDYFKFQDVCYVRMTGAGAVTTAINCTAVRTGAGVYELTHAQNLPVPPPPGEPAPTARGVRIADSRLWAEITPFTPSRSYSVETVDELVKRVRFLNEAGAAADADFEATLGTLLV